MRALIGVGRDMSDVRDVGLCVISWHARELSHLGRPHQFDHRIPCYRGALARNRGEYMHVSAPINIEVAVCVALVADYAPEWRPAFLAC